MSLTLPAMNIYEILHASKMIFCFHACLIIFVMNKGSSVDPTACVTGMSSVSPHLGLCTVTRHWNYWRNSIGIALPNSIFPL